MKKISIIVNCHNGEKYLDKCIKSILNQKYQNFELIFFDNFSSDNSKKIIKNYDDNRIKYYFSDKLLTLYKARNEAIKKSTCSLIAFLDVDDWWDENYLFSKKFFFDTDQYDFFYTNVLCFHEKKDKLIKYSQEKLPNGKIYDYLAKDYFIIISGLIIKKEILEKENYFNSSYNIIGDFDLLLRISKYANAKSFDEPLVYYRVHENNFSKKNNKMYFDEYNDWFQSQKNSGDKLFLKNIKYFQSRLDKLEIIYLLYQKRNFKLLKQIMKFPHLILRIKFFLAYFLPTRLINFFRK
tara:strand:- start:883 stop:1767 length:885 start_codon:yes stop_codon:yes gene_type:complete